MKDKPLKEWTWEELIDECTWATVQALIKGNVNAATIRNFQLIYNWLEAQGRIKK